MQPWSPLIQAVMRAVPRLPHRQQPPVEHAEWWERGLLDGVETMNVFAQEALAAISATARDDPAAVRTVVAELAALFATDGPRRADGRLDDEGLRHVLLSGPDDAPDERASPPVTPTHAQAANAIHTGVLREIVKDRAALGTHWIPVPVLLRRIQLEGPMHEIHSRLATVRKAVQRGDAASAAIELDLIDGLLRRMLDV